MAGISSKALAFGEPGNKLKYNGIEKEEDLQIEIYDAQLRELDGQTGRWWQIDPKIEDMEMWSPYASNYDNPIMYKDPFGDEPAGCCPDASAIVQGGFALGGHLVTKPNPAAVTVGGIVIVGTAAIGLGVEYVKAIEAHPEYAYQAGDAMFPSLPPNSPLLGKTLSGSNKSEASQSGGLGKAIVTLAKGTNNSKTKESVEVGQEAHRQRQADLKKEGAQTEVPMTLKDGTRVRKDAVDKDGTAVIIKPNTPSGQKSAEKRKNLLDKNGVPSRIDYYDPNDPKYKPGSPTYIGPKPKQQ